MLGDLRADIPEVADIAIAAKKAMAYYERMAEDPTDREYALTMLDLLCGDLAHLVAHCRYTIMQHEQQETSHGAGH